MFDQVVKLSQKLTYDRSETLLYIAEKMAETGNMSRETLLFNQALQRSQKIESEYERSSELCGIVESMLRIGQFERAFQIAQQIPDGMMRLQTLATLVVEMRKVKTIK